MYSKITAFVGLFHTKVNIISHAPIRKRQITVRLSGHARILGSQGGTGFISPFRAPQILRWHLDLWKFVHPPPQRDNTALLNDT